MTYQYHQARGPLYDRQMTANRASVCCYAEQHLNATTDQRVNYAIAVVAPNASAKTQAWARTYTALVAREFGIRDAGIVVGGRGSYNLQFVHAPAVLLEPGFVSHPEFARVVATGEGIDALARCLIGSIRTHFDCGLVALSVGHMYRGTGDKGAPVADAEEPAWDQEAEIADAVVEAAAQMLVQSKGVGT